jgi:VIT1/CCC1 family predicted Fe2+/Mn2+ transporter
VREAESLYFNLLTSNRESYQATKRKCQQLVRTSKTTTSEIVQNHFRKYQLDDNNSAAISKTIHDSPEVLISFLMTHHFDAAEPPDSRPWISALTLAVAYFSGGFIPLIPYFAVAKDGVLKGLWWSIGIMGVVLLVFGYVKTCVVRGWHGTDNVIAASRGAVQMALVGAAAAGAAVGLVRAINHEGYIAGS